LGKNYKKPVFIKTSTELHREGYFIKGINMNEITELRENGCREI
jgi:hypothetical protein